MQRQSTLVGLLAAALFAGAAPAQVVAYHDASSATHQTQFNTLSGSGYRMISLSIYGTAASPQYAAVWVQRAGPGYIGFHDLTSAQYDALVNQWCNTHSPRILTASGAGGSARFAGVLEQANHPCWARHGITSDQLNAELKDVYDAHWRIATIDVYGTSADPRYIVAFEPNDDNRGTGMYRANGVNGHQSLFDGMKEGWCRPVCVGFNDDSSKFVALWHDTEVGPWIAEHDMTSAEYQTRTTNYYNQFGYYPISVQASGDGSSARFAAVWAATDLPAPRQFSSSGQQVPELASFDGWMQNWMQSTGTRAASLAIVRDGVLEFARGYTWAEAGYPQTQPTSRFRIASCTKPLTSIAIHQEIQQSPAAIDYGSLMVDFFGNPTVADGNTNLIDVKDLLMHQGGWDRSVETGSGIDPMFYDTQIAAAQNTSVPISTTNIRTWMEGRPLDFFPGTQYQYSNYGFSLLGRILEVRNPGKTYAQIMQAQVFGPLGITRAVIGGAHKNQAFNDEVRYHPQVLNVARSVNDALTPWVPSQYGGWNMQNLDAHGAYVMATPDFAKVLAAFDLGLFNPILGPTQTGRMWTGNNATSGWLKGWFRDFVQDGLGQSKEMRWHNGILPGTRAYIGRREDGLSFVLFANGDIDIGSVEGQQLNTLANAVVRWPTNDLFPSVGVPAFHRIDDILAPYGGGCPGSTGLARTSGSGSADLGSRLSIDLSAGLPGSVAVNVLGLVPVSVDLGFVGATGCSLLVDPASLMFVPTSSTGAASRLFDVPVDPSIVGVHLFSQFGVLDARANGAGFATTNGLDITIGGWSGY